VPCPICGIRKPRRHCPALSADICPICCATGREETIDCPLGCEYLHDAHRHEAKPDYEAKNVPNLDINVTESFLAQHEVLLAFLAIAIFEGALPNPVLTDYDIREAFESLIRTYKAGESGLIVELRPVNVYAAGVVDHVLAKVADIRQRETEATGKTTVTDDVLLRILAFLQRLEYSHNNGRKRCRAFLDFLSSFYSPDLQAAVDDEDDDEDGLTEPGEPLIVL
jgi:hypothetical protein